MQEERSLLIENVTEWIGSLSSLVFHVTLFITTLLIGVFHILSWDIALLALTAGISFEAISLSIFIQMSTNKRSQIMDGVKQNIDEIKEEETHDREHQKTLEAMSLNLQKLLESIEMKEVEKG